MMRIIRYIFFLLLISLTACGGCSDEKVGLTGDACDDATECRGDCVGGSCEGFGDNGYDGEACNADGDCRGTCEEGSCAGGGEAPNNANNANNTNNTNNTTFETNGEGQVLCGNEPCACDNGMDDDGDGLIDGFDPECTGPYDDDEETFATGIPGDNKDPKWQDCFFDGNSGAGDDRCRYHTDCITGAKSMDDKDCQLAQACIDFCFPRAPNGCDCFGCCEVSLDNDATAFIQIGSEDCSLDDIDNCSTCVQNDVCVNTCGECELCLGKTIADLPASCSNGGGFDGDPCVVDADCRGMCESSECSGHGDGGANGDDCVVDNDCRGLCGTDGKCEGGGNGFNGDPCEDTTDCRGTCGGNDTCEGFGSGGFDGETCMSDLDCRGMCTNGTCAGGGAGGGSGVQCEDSDKTSCEIDNQCTVREYCQQGCCHVAPL